MPRTSLSITSVMINKWSNNQSTERESEKEQFCVSPRQFHLLSLSLIHRTTARFGNHYHINLKHEKMKNDFDITFFLLALSVAALLPGDKVARRSLVPCVCMWRRRNTRSSIRKHSRSRCYQMIKYLPTA
jgi:hypothetical protein